VIIILDNQGVYYRMSHIRPKCFGNAVDFDAYTDGCRGCAHRLDCSQEIQRIQARMRAPAGPSTSPYVSATSPPPRPVYQSPTPSPTYQSPYAQTPQHAPQSQYDFTMPLPEQFGAYIGFSFLDVLCFELRHLVGAARSDYMAKKRKP
jgi:hypothetical protein